MKLYPVYNMDLFLLVVICGNHTLISRCISEKKMGGSELLVREEGRLSIIYLSVDQYIYI